MAEQAHHLDEVGRLAALLFDGELNLEDRRRLEQMLSSDEESLSYYENYVEIHSLLHWQHGLAEKCETGYLQSYPPCDSCLPVSTFPAIVLFDGAIDNSHKLFLLGLAGGVPDGDGDFWDRALDRLPRVCVPACPDRQAIHTPLCLWERGRG